MDFWPKRRTIMKKIFSYVIIFLIALFLGYTLKQKENYLEIMAVTGATPLALKKEVPIDFSLKINGLVKKEYFFSGKALRAFSTTRIRTREITPGKKFLGTYIYEGIPVFNILEGIAPQKSKDAVFDRPLDLLVTFISTKGEKRYFSYGELTMTDDQHPVTLAFDRQQLLPSKDSDKYKLNLYKDNLKGLRLICPREVDNARYLDQVERINFSLLSSPDKLLPKMEKGKKCSSQEIFCCQGESINEAIFSGVSEKQIENWVRVGHGRGYKGVSKGEGYNLRSFLKENFPLAKENDFFLFIACDGYRSLFSGREIFSTKAGESFLLLKKLNDKTPSGIQMLAPIDDYFVDRDLWGLSHIACLPTPK